ncbi:TonB-dependent receptor [Pseudopedobacter saltans DSM 12145]|uniref:TonB-dependent receptor n=1 Tax=Pseudopedobacter saltans (strain ATCC 51119 / DSM 12145 / JCM 21818 / CCUG 39354 / LMG 10337 / NBRC 100064 / NCIMB 13643) TaxID=762903 RepID=F0SAM4_PSESL|nr:TonB-dependent receptor [Pseudopedobacter saltans]ADY53645.1 TonB-dependent receptor [Pseudopedobacter saltans DSM 12145]
MKLAMLIAFFTPIFLFAQESVLTGKITDASSSDVMVGASVTLKDYNVTTQTNGSGGFTFKNLKNGRYLLQVSYIGFKPLEKVVQVNGNTHISLSLEKALLLADEVIVNATRASANSATTFKNINKEEIEKNNFGQDIPYLLNQMPSMVVSSDAGAGVGYTSMRVRGSDATRVNVTINGIPYNDAESQGSFFVNLPDFASSVDNMQLQRGVGTSTNGAGAFGASLNIQTSVLTDSAYAEINNAAGSYGTLKNTVKVGTGLINGKWTFDGRLSRIISDGYIDRGSSNLKSYYLSGAYYGKKSILRAVTFSGQEKTYQAWNGIPEAKLKGSQADLLDHYYRNQGDLYNTVEDSLNLFNSDPRKFNMFSYKNQTDNYTQNNHQLLYSKEINNQLSFNGALHYTKGAGYYEEYKYGQKFNKYGLTPITINGTTINKTDLVRRRWLDNHFYGLTYALNYRPSNIFDFVLGGAYNEYKGEHFGEVIWARYASQTENDYRYYDNDATKKDFNVFGKATAKFNQLNLFADLQYRRVDYTFVGKDHNGVDLEQNAVSNFFNPKVGATYQLDEKSNIYASYAIANKEPSRKDYTESSTNSRPKPEQLHDIELGYRYLRNNVTAGLNLFGMFYKDQLILTGEINDVGSYVRSNVDDSYRIGVEFDSKWAVSPKFSWGVNASLSDHKIKEFHEFFDEYDANFAPIGQQENVYKNTNIAFAPKFIAGNEFAYKPCKGVEAAFISKYVSKQYLDNTSNEARKLDAFFVNDIRLGYQFQALGLRNIGLALQVNNIFNEKYESNGYTYGYIFDGNLVTENFYFPQAGTSFMFSLNVKF